jgi:hypothetical protein
MTSSVYPISSLLSILAVVRLRNGPSVSSWIAFQANPIMAKAHLTRKSALYSCLPSEPVRTHFSIYSLFYCTLNFLLHLTFTSPCLRRQAFLFPFSLLVILDGMHFLVSSLVVSRHLNKTRNILKITKGNTAGLKRYWKCSSCVCMVVRALYF